MTEQTFIDVLAHVMKQQDNIIALCNTTSISFINYPPVSHPLKDKCEASEIKQEYEIYKNTRFSHCSKFVSYRIDKITFYYE